MKFFKAATKTTHPSASSRLVHNNAALREQAGDEKDDSDSPSNLSCDSDAPSEQSDDTPDIKGASCWLSDDRPACVRVCVCVCVCVCTRAFVRSAGCVYVSACNLLKSFPRLCHCGIHYMYN